MYASCRSGLVIGCAFVLFGCESKQTESVTNAENANKPNDVREDGNSGQIAVGENREKSTDDGYNREITQHAGQQGQELETFVISGQLQIGNLGLVGDVVPNKVWGVRIPSASNAMPGAPYTKMVDIKSDGSFDFEVSEGEKDDWVLALIDTNQADRLDQFVNFISISGDRDSIIGIPMGFAERDLDLGRLQIQDGEAQSSNNIDASSNSFALSAHQLKEWASVDNSLRSVKNIFLNIDPLDTSAAHNENRPNDIKWLRGSSSFAWRGIRDSGSNNDLRNQYSSTSQFVPLVETSNPASSYQGFSASIWSNRTSQRDPSMFSFKQFCGNDALNTPKLQIKVLTPRDSSDVPLTIHLNNQNYAEFTNGDSVTAGSIDSSFGMSSGVCSFANANALSFSTENVFNLTLPNNMGKRADGTVDAIPAGMWKLQMGPYSGGAMDTMAMFELGTSNPVDSNGDSTLYFPSVMLVVDDNDLVTAARLRWYKHQQSISNPAQQEAVLVSDRGIMEKVIGNFGSYMDDYNGYRDLNCPAETVSANCTQSQRQSNNTGFADWTAVMKTDGSGEVDYWELTKFSQDGVSGNDDLRWKYFVADNNQNTNFDVHPVMERFVVNYEIGDISYVWSW